MDLETGEAEGGTCIESLLMMKKKERGLREPLPL
jgi:hypothetical protein